MDKETEKKMRDEWRTTKFFDEIDKPDRELLRRSFPWISMFKTEVVQENVSSIKSNYDIARRWKQKGNRLFFKTNEEEYYFEMPIG